MMILPIINRDVKLNIVFAGTPHFALPCLDAIAQSNEHQLIAVYTQPDRPAGRGHKLQPSPVKQWALAHDIPVYQPLNFKTQETIDELTALSPDILVVIAYGLILPNAVLNIPRFGCVNVHASLLPRWRGASPIQQAILNHDAETGITIMQMDTGMDTGAMLKIVTCPISDQDTAEHLSHKLERLAPMPLLSVLENLANGTQKSTPQDNHLASYAPKIHKHDAAICWEQTAQTIDCQIRAFNPWPIAYTIANEDILKIHEARVIDVDCTERPGTILDINTEGIHVATGHQVLLIQRLQFAGGKIITVADWLNANRNQISVNQVLK
jgi:methionyl-tRNA formyltransferase